MNTNKIDLIKAEVERLHNELIQEKKKGFGSDADDACILELQNVLTYIDSLKEEPKFKTGDRIKPVDSCLGAPRTILEVCDGWYVTNQGTLDFEFEDNWEAVEEPVSEFLNTESMIESYKQRLISQANGMKNSPLIDMCLVSYKHGINETLDALKLSNVQKTVKNWKEPVSEELEEASKNYALNNTPWDDCKDEIQEAFKAGAKWQKQKDSIPVSKELGEYINELSKQFPEVSFAKLSRIVVRVAKWQKGQFEKDCADLCNGIATAKGIAVAMAYDKGVADTKEQMMANAIDAQVLENYDGKVIKYDETILDERLSDCKVFDKVKVIIIKED